MTNTFEAVERLRADLALLTADLETKSRIAAVSGVETGDSMVDAAREIVAVREQLRLKRMALHEAERRHEAEKEKAEKALRDADRERCCELTDELEKTGKTFVLAIKRAAKHYERLYELESSLRVAAATASGWPKDWGWGSLGEKPFAMLMGAVCDNYSVPKIPPSNWPTGNKATRLTDPGHVYSSIFLQREQWRNPQPEELNEEGYREAEPEDFEHVA